MGDIEKEKTNDLEPGDTANENKDESMNIFIQQDKMKVFCRFHKPVGEGQLLTYDQIMRELKVAGVVFGIQDDEIKDFLNDRQYEVDYIIAIGRAMELGKNGSIELRFDTNSNLTPEVDESGNVDYKNLNLVNQVKKGDILAVKIPHSVGADGQDVLGHVVPAVPGKAANFVYGKNVYVSEDGLNLISNVDGHVTYKSDKIAVSEVLEIKEDVDLSTGNIKFNGQVLVHGSVKSGFNIQCKGDVIVEGSVEDAVIVSGGDVIVKRGVQGGGKGVITAKKNLIAKFIENATVIAGGDVKSESVLYSQVTCNGNLHILGKKGMLTGGRMQVLGSIDAVSVGSNMGTATRIELGIDQQTKKEYDTVRRQIRELTNSLDSMKMIVESFTQKIKAKVPLAEDKVNYFKQTLQKFKFQQKMLEEAKDKEQKLMESLRRGTDSYLAVTAETYPGVIIVIKDVTYNVEAVEHHIRFVKTDEGIKKVPL